MFIALLFSISACTKNTKYPIARTFSDPKDGSPIAVNITGRTATHVEFTRVKDSKFFSYPLSKLNPKDRKYVEQLPLAKTDEKLVPAVARNNPPYIQTRLERISQLQKSIALLEKEIKGEQTNPGMLTQHNRQIADKQKEIQELTAAIKRHRE
ncbi:MAG: hypothetical protein QM496_00725 [Verrucomicrobiota bacterium]